jgi:hypothetical protein
MAVPNVLNNKDLRLYVSDGTGGPTRFDTGFVCILETFSLDEENTSEVKYFPDCADPDIIPQQTVEVTGQRWGLSGSGTLDPGNVGYQRFLAARLSGALLEIRYVENRAGARTITGFVRVLKASTSKASVAGFSTFTLECQGNGSYTETVTA